MHTILQLPSRFLQFQTTVLILCNYFLYLFDFHIVLSSCLFHHSRHKCLAPLSLTLPHADRAAASASTACNSTHYHLTLEAEVLLSQASMSIIFSSFSNPSSLSILITVACSSSVKKRITFMLCRVSFACSYTPT